MIASLSSSRSATQLSVGKITLVGRFRLISESRFFRSAFDELP